MKNEYVKKHFVSALVRATLTILVIAVIVLFFANVGARF